MDRRRFLAASGLASVLPVLGHAGAAQPSAGPGKGRGLSKRVDFVSDGLGLDPREYATLLQQAATRELAPDYYSNGGAIAALEQAFAQQLGKQAALFVPTGTLANHLAVRTLAGHDRRVLVQADSHLYCDSGDCAQTLSGLNLVPLAPGGAINLAQVREAVERAAGGRVPARVGVISIESPVRRQDHAMVDFEELQRIAAYARGQGIRLHLDGARLFNLPLHSGRSVREHAALFDTVYVSLWKHFNGASGAVLAGDAAFIEGLYHQRRMFGGSLPQAWPQVAFVVEHMRRYEADYAAAWQAAERLLARLEADGRFKAHRVAAGTSRFLLSASRVEPEAWAARLAKRDIVLGPHIPGTDRFVLQVNPTLLRVPPDVLARRFIEAADG